VPAAAAAAAAAAAEEEEQEEEEEAAALRALVSASTFLARAAWADVTAARLSSSSATRLVFVATSACASKKTERSVLKIL
jgi:hypothetical protein